jgi:phospholipid/cholesterol/gamma-HCH transport system substrate-binding protein
VSRYIKIGLFVTVTTVLLIGYMLRTADTVGGSGGSYTVHAYMEDASGLVVDSAVRLAGVQVGRLTDIQLDENRARLTIELQDDVKNAEDSIISKQPSTMHRRATEAINPGNGQGAMLQDGDVVRNVRQQAALSDVMVNANDLAAEATSFVTELNRYLAEEGTMDALDEIVDVVRQTTLSASQLIEENLLLVRASMQNVEEFTGRVNQDSIRQIMTLQEILDNTASLTARLDQLVGDNDESLTRSIRGIEENLTELRAVLASVQTSADNVAEVTQIVRDGDSTVGKLLTNDEFYERVDRIAGKTPAGVSARVKKTSTIRSGSRAPPYRRRWRRVPRRLPPSPAPPRPALKRRTSAPMSSNSTPSLLARGAPLPSGAGSSKTPAASASTCARSTSSP